MKSNKILCNKE